MTYPYQVIKSRLQQRVLPPVAGEGGPGTGATPTPPPRRYTGLIDAAVQIGRLEGPLGFYKGFAANLLRVAPQSAITLMAYEHISALMVGTAGTAAAAADAAAKR